MTRYMPPNRFYSLDVLRGVAALSIVWWHWQHFFLPLNKQGVLFSIEKQPLYSALFIVYEHGIAAIQLFFCLSGFIFFWLYSKRIAERTTSLRSFSVMRLSRLYPLHFITLVFVAVGQLVYASTSNTFFVYLFNDSYHFFLNVLLVSSWGLEKGFSFNGPVWVVSVEVLLYAIFFVFCRLFPRKATIVIAAIIAGHFIVSKFSNLIATGVECFFIGGLVYIAYDRIIKRNDVRSTTTRLSFITILLWLITIVAVNPHHGFLTGELPRILRKIAANWSSFVLFPMTILSLVLVETKKGALGKRLSFIGDISYSLYLLHFPLQLVVATVTARLALDQALFYSPWFMTSFFFILILMSLASHRYLEVPMQRFLRLHTGAAR
jgi:peptidoglycan/LPS O-acetylase OafA/YrhL